MYHRHNDLRERAHQHKLVAVSWHHVTGQQCCVSHLVFYMSMDEEQLSSPSRGIDHGKVLRSGNWETEHFYINTHTGHVRDWKNNLWMLMLEDWLILNHHCVSSSVHMWLHSRDDSESSCGTIITYPLKHCYYQPAPQERTHCIQLQCVTSEPLSSAS